jgi:rhamnosyltransferase subunit B
MSKIVFTTIGSLGDLYPQIAIAIELRQRGHQIVFAVASEYQPMLRSLGFECATLRPDDPAINNPAAMARIKDLQTGAAYTVTQWLLPNLADTYTDLLNSAQAADLIIAGDIVYAAPLVAEKLNIPWISLALAPISFISITDPSVPLLPLLEKLQVLGLSINHRTIELFKAITKSWAEPIHQLRRELELAPISENPIVDRSAAALVLAIFSAVLAPPQPDWPQHTIVTGFTFYDGTADDPELTPALQQFLDAGDPPIVFTLGSAVVMIPGTFYQDSVAAAQQLNRRAVLLIGNNAPPDHLPAGIMAIDYLPYAQIFPHACAIVHQGGVGTTAQALRAGIPTLIMPYSYDQPDNAARVERLGTSRTIDRSEYIAARVSAELNLLLENPLYADNATKIGLMLRREDGVKVACDQIIQQLGAANKHWSKNCG